MKNARGKFRERFSFSVSILDVMPARLSFRIDCLPNLCIQVAGAFHFVSMNRQARGCTFLLFLCVFCAFFAFFAVKNFCKSRILVRRIFFCLRRGENVSQNPVFYCSCFNAKGAREMPCAFCRLFVLKQFLHGTTV
jgi:hypothetical protein